MVATHRHSDGGRYRAATAFALTIAAGVVALIFGFAAGGHGPARRHTIEVVARRFSFDPPVIRVERGDEMRLRFAAADVVHGFYLEGYGLDVTIEPLSREVTLRRKGGPPETVAEVTLVAAREGRFRYRCSRTCGSMHPFMVGELIVGPNWLLRVTSAVSVGLLGLGAFWTWRHGARRDPK